MGELVPNLDGYKVLTPDGWKDFAGVSFMGDKQVISLEFENNISVKCTADHKIYTSLNDYKFAGDLVPDEQIWSSNGPVKLINKYIGDIEPVFDLVEVDDGHRYFADSILGSNCEFIINDETLIDSLVLSSLRGSDPAYKQGTVRWYKHIDPKSNYIVALDPSLGTGGDPAAIQVFEIPSMIQVAEWCNNKTPIPQQVRILIDISKYIEETTGPNSVYYSVENNSIGEAALISIADVGEENIPGMFLSEPKRAGNVRSFRRGFNTTNRSKLTTCAKLKTLIETDKLKVNSKMLISELKTFVAAGGSYAAKTGETDDLVMSTVLAVRMANELKNYVPDLERQIRDSNDYDVAPMPFIIM